MELGGRSHQNSHPLTIDVPSKSWHHLTLDRSKNEININNIFFYTSGQKARACSNRAECLSVVVVSLLLSHILVTNQSIPFRFFANASNQKESNSPNVSPSPDWSHTHLPMNLPKIHPILETPNLHMTSEPYPHGFFFAPLCSKRSEEGWKMP